MMSCSSTAAVPSASNEGDVARLASELAALQARQQDLLPQLRHRNRVDETLLADVEATFARVPEYVAKLTRVQQSMDTLALRTANMRARCERLVNDD